jgi:hypothetical protein
MTDRMIPANNPQMGDDFAAVYEATAQPDHRTRFEHCSGPRGRRPGYPGSGYRSRRRGAERSGGGTEG